MNEDLHGYIVVGTFLVMFLSVPYWFWLIRRLDRHMKTHHSALHRALGIGDLLPGNTSEAVDFDNTDASLSLAGFLWRRDDQALNDPDLSAIVTQMRGFAAVFVAGFCLLILAAIVLEFS